MANIITTFDLITSKDIFESTRAIVASNLAVTAAMIASTAKTQITNEAIREAKRVFELSLAQLPLYKPTKK